jgi:hypothetical protein
VKRSLAAIALVASLASCSPKQTMLAGGAVAVGGLVLAVTPDTCEGFCLLTNREVGAGIVVVGALIAAIGLFQSTQEGWQIDPNSKVLPYTGPPFANTGAQFPPPANSATPALAPPGLQPPAKPLPALELHYNSPADRQFAIQTSAAARRGDCVAAIATAKHLSVDDRHRLATVDADYARCAQQ